ncbi:MAG: GGDEF domain-containing protein [Verrucomicrobia bacterium]|nr:GGDEF domain-containing protein [Verrucomicrobiota bacterium]
MHDTLQRRLAEIGAPADVRKLADELAQQAVRDPLTGLYNRRFFNAALAQNIEAACRYGRELSLVLLDIDQFKAVNDACGHEAGDAVLRTFAKLLQETARKADVVCRIGGDEFAVILPETGLSNARKFAERFFQTLERCGEIFPNIGKIKASAGVAALPSENLFAAADSELLGSKRKNAR